MPLYDYKCNKCESVVTKIIKMDDRKVPESEPCPECGALEVRMMMSAPKIAYGNAGSMKTTDSFNDRLKEIKKGIPKKYQDKLSNNIR